MLLNTKFYDKENKREAQSMTVTTRNTALKTSIQLHKDPTGTSVAFVQLRAMGEFCFFKYFFGSNYVNVALIIFM